MGTKLGDVSPLPESNGDSSRAFEFNQHDDEFTAAANIISKPVDSNEFAKKANYASFAFSAETSGETNSVPGRAP